MSSLLQGWQEDFLLSKTTRLAPKTIQNYELGTRQFIEYVGDKWPITKADILSFLNEVKSRAAPDTVSTYWRHLHAFFVYIENIGGISQKNNPVREIKALGLAPKNPRKMPKGLARSDVSLLLGHLNRIKETDIHSLRDYTLINMLYLCGCRTGEACSLTIGQVNLTERFAFIEAEDSKSNQDRYIYFGSKLRDILDAWIEHLDKSEYAGVWLFPTIKGVGHNTPQSRPLTPSGVYQAFKKRCKDAGIKRSYRAHDLRHTFTRRAIQAGIGLDEIRLQLGHRDTTMVLYYGQANAQDQKLAFQDFGDD